MNQTDTALSGAAFSEERLERFVRGEEDLDFRTPFQIRTDKLSMRVSDGDSDDAPQQLHITGIATTSDTDSNGVTVIPSALRSLPRNFKSRSTLLFNHDFNMPIGRIGKSKFVEDGDEAFVEVEAFVNVDARNPQTGMRFADDIENGTLSKFSFAWSTRDGEMIFKKTKHEDEEEEDKDVLFRFKFGLDHAPEIIVRKLEAVELSVVSVPADAGAEFAVRNMQRSLSSIAQRFVWDEEKGIMIPKPVRDISDPSVDETAAKAASVETVVAETVNDEVVPEEREAESTVTEEDNSSAWDGFDEELSSLQSPKQDAWAGFENEIEALGGANRE